MNRQQRVMMLCGLVIVGAVMLGCAGNAGNTRADNRDAAPEYTNELARARASVADAEQAGAAQFGDAELARARDKLRAAERAADDGDLERASQLAIEADLDASLATAKTRNGETQELVTQVRSGLRTLEDELRREQQGSVSRP